MATVKDDTTAKPKPETKEQAESLIPQFQLTRVLNQDQNGRRISLLGTIKDQQGILVLERAAFPSDPEVINKYLEGLHGVENLGANDIYRWYMASHRAQHPQQNASHNGGRQSESKSKTKSSSAPDLKLNLIYPCTPSHIRKYTSQPLRYVTETPAIYRDHIAPYIARTQRTAKRLDWIYNILDGRTEQEDVVYRSPDFGQRSSTTQDDRSEAFLLLPDLNWDRRTVRGLHLLALVERRDIWSLRGLKKSDVRWLKHLRAEVVRAAAKVGTELARKNINNTTTDAETEAASETVVVEEDMLKCYVHYQPTYYHFHVHVVHVMLEAEGSTQSVGKAFALENLISQLETMQGTEDAGLDGVDLSYFLGEENELWKKCFEKIKKGERVDLNDE